MSMDCGAETFANISNSTSDDAPFTGTVGRVQVSKYAKDGKKMNYIRVGHYDVSEKPAILLFPDANCELYPKRFYWSPEDDNGSMFNHDDLKLQDFSGLADTHKAIMVPPGLIVTTYYAANWSGATTKYEGRKSRKPELDAIDPSKVKTGYAPGIEDMECQTLSSYLASLRIDKVPKRKPIGYWKGITASSSQDFTYTVGIVNDKKTKDSHDDAEKL